MTAWCEPRDADGGPLPTCRACGNLCINTGAGYRCTSCGARQDGRPPPAVDPSSLCPVCGAVAINERCKLVCPSCHALVSNCNGD